jgi:hypothetical protein
MDIKEKINKIVEKHESPTFLLEKEEKKEPIPTKEPEEKLPKQQGSLEDKIIAFLSENPNPSDDVLHKWAEEQKLDIHQVETATYKLATTKVKFLVGGRSVQKGVSAKGVDSNELKMGIEVEYEHTTDKDTAERIALDHLAELPDYYTRLKKMEKEGGVAEEPKKKEEVSESIKIDVLKKFDKSRTQTAVRRAIDTLTELEEEGAFGGKEENDKTDASYVRSVISLLHKVLFKLKNNVIQ